MNSTSFLMEGPNFQSYMEKGFPRNNATLYSVVETTDTDDSTMGENDIALQMFIQTMCLIVCVFISHGIDEFRHTRLENKYRINSTTVMKLFGWISHLPESGVAMVIGFIISYILKGFFGIEIYFSDGFFFYFVLPPIIFYQGYALKKRNFFRYFHYIIVFGVFGTLIGFTILTSLSYHLSQLPIFGLKEDGVAIPLDLHDCMLIASVFSAADEVATLAFIKQDTHPKLSAILFGEGVINDAVSILLFRSVLDSTKGATKDDSSFYTLVMAALIGIGVSCIVARLLKIMPSLKHHPTRQAAIVVLGAYVSFATSELFGYSGILTIFFSGFILSHFAWHSLSHEAKTGTGILFHTLSSIAEIYCFTGVGLSIFSFETTNWDFSFVVFIMVAMVIGRFVSIFGFCALARFILPKKFSIPFKQQLVIFYGGLLRGSISWAQVIQIRSSHREVMITTTLGVILFTNIVLGASMQTFLSYMDILPSLTTDIGEIKGIVDEEDVIDQGSINLTSQTSEQISLDPLKEKKTNLSKHEKNLSAASFLSALAGQRGRPQMHLRNQSVESAVSGVPVGGLQGCIHRCWAYLDEMYLKPFLGGKTRPQTYEEECLRQGIPSTYNFEHLDENDDSVEDERKSHSYGT